MYRVGREEVEAVTQVILSKEWFRYGNPEAGHLGMVDKFEAEWAARLGSDYSLLLSGGGTAALICSLAALGIGPGDEVLVPAYTWLATASAVLAVGAMPVLVEVDDRMTMDPQDVRQKFGPRVKAIMPVHMNGRPSDMGALLEVAREHGVSVVEDACQSIGGSYGGRALGTLGDIGAYSLNQFKIISAGGEGGILVTSDRTLFERAFIFHDSGCAFRTQAGELTVPVFVAQQYRASEIMGALARVQVGRLDGILGDLRSAYRRIKNAVSDIPELEVIESHDPSGDCCVVIAFRFASEELTRRFAELIGWTGYVGIDHGKHVYTEWTPIVERRTMHHPAMDPYSFPANANCRSRFDKEACPRTLDLLRRTFFYTLSPDWSAEEIDRRIEVLRASGKALAGS